MEHEITGQEYWLKPRCKCGNRKLNSACGCGTCENCGGACFCRKDWIPQPINSISLPPEKIYIVVIQDRHTGVGIYPFSTYKKAKEFWSWFVSDKEREENEDIELDCEEFTDHFIYSCEGDCVYIITREIDNTDYLE